jgi:putative colanic acid biosynthesis glycosyltransferase
LKVSVITVVLNDPLGFEKTADSIVAQQYEHPEWIVIDGSSSGEMKEMMGRYRQHINQMISEPDNGPYDAMNKGLARATGEWVIFMNAGDAFAGPGVLSSLFAEDIEDADVIYGDWITDYQQFGLLRKAGHPADLWKGMVFSHQAMAIRTGLARQHGFNPAYPIGADYDMVVQLFMAGRKFLYFPEPIAIVETQGISHRNMVKSAREHYNLFCRYKNPTTGQKFFHYRKVFFLWLIEKAYQILPMNLILALIKFAGRKSLVPQSGSEPGLYKTR